MRSIVLVILALLALATTPARAQTAWLESKMMERMCGAASPPGDADRMAKRLNLTDPQKAALKDMMDASAAGAASAKTALCADKPDLSTTPGRMAFSEKMMETRLANLKTVEPKLQAFYDSLDAKQKTAFDSGGRVGGLFSWWGKQ
jgi:LTXXQ motif family protein